MPEDRITTAMRLRRSMLRALDEVADLQGGISREVTVHLLLRDGLAAWYERMGIDSDPAIQAGELLRVIANSWESELSDQEITAFGVVGKALERIAQVRDRETPQED
jgi:hypothetical protein